MALSFLLLRTPQQPLWRLLAPPAPLLRLAHLLPPHPPASMAPLRLLALLQQLLAPLALVPAWWVHRLLAPA